MTAAPGPPGRAPRTAPGAPLRRDVVVAHYHEVGLKGRNRSYFERRLVDNIAHALVGLGAARVRALPGRILIDLAPGAEPRTHLLWKGFDETFNFLSLLLLIGTFRFLTFLDFRELVFQQDDPGRERSDSLDLCLQGIDLLVEDGDEFLQLIDLLTVRFCGHCSHLYLTRPPASSGQACWTGSRARHPKDGRD